MKHSAGRKERRRLARSNRRAQGRAYAKSHNYYQSHPWAFANAVKKWRKAQEEKLRKQKIEEELHGKDTGRA